MTASRRDRLTILATERNAEEYEIKADVVDGDAYYWSSANPDTYPDAKGKLQAMSAAVDRHQGLWIAPAAPGFDARKIGGTSVVPRRDGDTFRRELATALSSRPDMLGVISWNEFSENSQIEPSTAHGDTRAQRARRRAARVAAVGQRLRLERPLGRRRRGRRPARRRRRAGAAGRRDRPAAATAARRARPPWPGAAVGRGPRGPVPGRCAAGLSG